MTRDEIIKNIAKKLPVVIMPYIPTISNYSTHNEVMNIINGIVIHLNSNIKTNEQFVLEIITILEQYHNLNFHNKLEDIIK